MRTKVICNKHKCDFNYKGQCEKRFISIDSDLGCISYFRQGEDYKYKSIPDEEDPPSLRSNAY